DQRRRAHRVRAARAGIEAHRAVHPAGESLVRPLPRARAGPGGMKSGLREHLPAWIFLFALLAVWEAVVRNGFIADYLLPAPSDIWVTAVELRQELWAATLSTLGSILWGLGASFVIGIA